MTENGNDYVFPAEAEAERECKIELRIPQFRKTTSTSLCFDRTEHRGHFFDQTDFKRKGRNSFT